MPDITLCCNCDCPLRAECVRYRAKPDEYWQSYARYKPEHDGCGYFWHIQESHYVLLPVEKVDEIHKKGDK